MSATLQVCKDTASEGGTYQFSVTGNNPSPEQFSLMPGDCQAVTINQGDYAITENFHGTASVGLDSDCTLTNDDPPTASGNIQAGQTQSCSFLNEIEYVFLNEWGSFGSGDGEFDFPQGIAVDPSTGNVFVADTYNNRIQVFALT